MNYPKEILDTLPVMATQIDMHTHAILFANRHTRSIFGDVIGKTCWQVLQKDQHAPCPFCSDKHLVDKNGSPSGNYRQQVKNTLTQRWFDIIESASMTEDGRLVKMSIAVDITDQRSPMSVMAPGRSRLVAESIDPQKMIVMCSHCQKIRSPVGHWLSPAHYLIDEMGIIVSHGVCSACAKLLYPGFGCDDNET